MTPDEIKALRKDLACTAKELAHAIGIEQATVYADRLRSRVEMRGADLRTRFNKTRPLTVSGGVTQAVPQAGDDIERIIARVDEGLYEAKEAGRNRFVVKQPPEAE